MPRSGFAPGEGVDDDRDARRPSGFRRRFRRTCPSDHAALPVWNAENWFYEDWPVGQKIRSLRRTMSEGDSHLFNALVTDIHPYVQDQMFAEREGVFGKRLIAGAFVFSAGLGLVATNCINAFSYGYDKLPLHQAGVHRRHDLHDPHQPR